MGNSDRIDVLVGAQIGELKAGMDQAVDKVKTTTSQIQTDFQDTASQIKSAFTFAAGALGIYEIGSALKSAFQQGIQAVDDFKLTTIGVAATITDMAKDQSSGQENYTRALAYSKDMFQELELAAARYFASGKEMTQAWNILAQKGIVLRKDEIDSLGVIVDRIKLSTQGQVSSIQIAQEMRAILTGQARVTDQIGMLLKDRIPNLEAEIDKHRKIGDLVKWLGDQFKGLAYASEDIQNTLESQKSTLGTLLTQVGRGGLETAYGEIVNYLSQMNDYILKHRDELAGGISRGWEGVKDLTKGTLGFIQEIANIAKKGIVIPVSFSIGGMGKWLSEAGEGGTYDVEDFWGKKSKITVPSTPDFGFGALFQKQYSQAEKDSWTEFSGYETPLPSSAWGVPKPPATNQPGGKGSKGGGGGDKSRVSAWQAELEEMKQAEGNFFNFSKEQEIGFWKDKLAECEEGSNEYIQVKHKMHSLEQAQAKENLQKDIANLKFQQESAKTSGEQRLAIQDQIMARLAASYGKDSKEYIQAEQQKVKIAREVEQEKLKIAQEHIQKQVELNNIDLDIERENTRFKTQLGAQNQAQEITSLMKLKQQEYQIERKALEDQLKLDGLTLQNRKKLNDQLLQLDKKQTLEMTKLNNQHTLALKVQWDQLWSSMGRAFTMSLQGMAQGTTTLSAAMGNMLQNILASVAEMSVQMVLQWAGSKIAMLAIDAAASAGLITNASAVAAAKSYSAYASIPWVGIALGAAAAAAMIGLTMAFKGNLASAAGGWDIPEDSLAYVHKKEMILPEYLSERIRNMTGLAPAAAGAAAGPSWGGDVNLHISAHDAQSVKAFFKNNRALVVAAVRDGVRDGLRIQ